MKLHRIRVENLNSLYGEQTLDLDADLHGASLFLILGPTGSGKSTLMDAVSLALFGTTPRLAGLGSEKVIAEQVMSRGTGLSLAELEFSKWSSSGEGRVRYRATWKARRAREKPDGTMQDTERSMEALERDGSWSLQVGSHKKKDYDPVFLEVLEGFTAADFQRSMLLAQGQFDAMLHATPKERADILERLTDTGDYQRLGERAARMRGAWEGRLAKRKALRDAIAPLSGEALDAARATLATVTEGLKALDAQQARLHSGRDWLTRRLALQRGLGEAQGALADVRARQQVAAEALSALSAHESCAEAFEALDRRTEADADLARHRDAQQQVAASLPGLLEAVGRTEGALSAAQTSWDAANQALDALRGPATQATSAMAQQTQAHKEAEGARQSLADATQRDGVARMSLEGATMARQVAAEALERAREALEACAGGVAAYQALPGLRSQGTALRARQEALDRGHRDAASRRQTVDAVQVALTAARAAHQAAWEATVAPRKLAHEQARETLRGWVGANDPEALAADLRRRIHATQAHREALQHMQVTLTAAIERQGDHQDRAKAVAAAEALLQEARAAEQRAAQAAGAARDGVSVAEQQLAPLQRIADLGSQRQVLEEGEPCPLCGSEAHPYVHDPAQRAQADAIEAEVAKANRALLEAKAARDVADRVHTLAVSATASAASRVTGAQDEAQRAQVLYTAALELAQEATQAAGYVVGLGLDALASERTKADVQRDALIARLDGLEAARAHERACNDALATAERAHADEATRLGQESARLTEAEEQLAHRAASLVADAEALAEGHSRLHAALTLVGVVAPGVHDGLAQAEAQAQAWTSAHEAHARAVVAYDKAEAAQQAATASFSQAAALRDEAAKALEGREEALRQAHSAAALARQDLEHMWIVAARLDGPGALARPGVDRPPAELVAFQADRVSALHEAQTTARSARDTVSKAHAEALARQATLAEAEVRLQATATARAIALAEALRALSLPDVPALVARRLGADAVAAARSLREGLHTDYTRAQATEKAAHEQLLRHDGERPPDLAGDATVDVLNASIVELDGLREAAQAQRDQSRATVEMAARDQAALAQAQAALDADEADARVWLHLHDLIGVGDGKRFKLFAQALNLDQLLGRANKHLEQLNERYRLLSISEKDTALPSLDFEVADRWRPGTTRSLKTLSGGEAFLVSLALALGLSDLRTSSMPVETLLLDEGFGTLDAATLDTALAALQQLQATGLQVGLISHVVGLQERIEAKVRVEPLGGGRSRVRVG